jgi:nucleotide-binding universal stress UspA family protein
VDGDPQLPGQRGLLEPQAARVPARRHQGEEPEVREEPGRVGQLLRPDHPLDRRQPDGSRTRLAGRRSAAGPRPPGGEAADAILATAAEQRADLIVIGNRGMGALAGHLLGSVPGDIAHRAPCDVLIVQTEQIARDDQLSA